MYLEKDVRFEIKSKNETGKIDFFWSSKKSEGDIRALLAHADAADQRLEKAELEVKGCGDLIAVLMNEKGFQLSDLGIVKSAAAAEQKFYGLMHKIAAYQSDIEKFEVVVSQRDAQIQQLQADAAILQASFNSMVERFGR